MTAAAVIGASTKNRSAIGFGLFHGMNEALASRGWIVGRTSVGHGFCDQFLPPRYRGPPGKDFAAVRNCASYLLAGRFPLKLLCGFYR